MLTYADVCALRSGSFLELHLMQNLFECQVDAKFT